VFAKIEDLRTLSGNNQLTYIADYKSAINYDNILEDINNIEFSLETVKDIIDAGYPCPTRNGIILSKSYLDNIFQNKPLEFNLPVIMSNKIVPRRHLISNQKIPRIIHQTFETKCLPHGLMMAAYSWINRNPDYEYKYYDDHDRRRFIETNFDTKTLSAYDSLIPGAYRADFWRYCVIFIEGGVYIDIKMGALLPLDRIISDDIDLMIVNDTHDMTLYNAFFAATPKHPAILRTIETVTNRVLNKEYGPHILYPTGPMAMGSSILPLYGYKIHAPNGKNHSDRGIIQVYSHSKIDGNTIIMDVNGNKLVKTRYDNSVDESYINKITGRPHYRFLWAKRDIYRK
jgi:mannosyltransferase OCH1-like enzyme